MADCGAGDAARHGLAGAGLVAGLAASVVLSRFMSSLLYGVGAGDPLTLVFVTVVLGVVAMLACLLPARRATAVDPSDCVAE